MARFEGLQGRDWCIITGLLFCTLFVFSQTLTFEFLMWDDEKFVVRHIERLGGLSAATIEWSLTNDENGWRTPLPYLSLFTDATLFGLNPAGYHLTNLLIHTASAILLFIALRWMTGNPWPSAAAAALFAIHPLHVEPVVWVTGRWELLCGFFWIVGMLAYVAYCRRPTAWRMTTVAIAFVGALASKPMALTFPFAMLLLDYWPLQRLWPVDNSSNDRLLGFSRKTLWGAIREKTLLFAITVVALLVALSAKSAYLADQEMLEFAWGLRMANAVQTYAIHVGQLFWPSQLSFYHLHPALRGGIIVWQLVAAAVLLVGVTMVSLLLAKRLPWLTVGWLWYLGVFVPAIGLVQVEYHARAERYTYLPLIGLLLIVCWGVARLFHGAPRRDLFLCGLCATVVGALMITARSEARYWRNSRSLFEQGLRVDPANYKALLNLGVLAEREGDHERAEMYYRRVLEFLPGESTANYNIGMVLYGRGEIDDAIVYAQRAARIAPLALKARYLLAACYVTKGDTAAAGEQYLMAIRSQPQEPAPYARYGNHLARSGQFDAAVAQYRQALRFGSRDARLPHRLSAALVESGHVAEAVRFYESYYRAHPDRFDIADELAWLLATHENESVRDGDAAVKIAEQLCAESHYANRYLLDTLSAAYAEAGRYEEAVDAANKSLRLARAADDQEHSTIVAARLVMFQNRQPYRQKQTLEPAASAGAHQQQEAVQ